MPSELRAIALFRSGLATSSGTIACQAGATSAAPMPPRKVRPINASMVSIEK
jgi:hypothetical protein